MSTGSGAVEERHFAQVQVLLRALAALADARSLPDTLRTIARAAAEVTRADRAYLAMAEPTGELGTVVAVSGSGLEDAPPPAEVLAALRALVTAAPVVETGNRLGLRLHARDETCGALYLAATAGQEFSSDDRDLVAGLALAAGTAIVDARGAAESARRSRWLAASVEIGTELLSDTAEDPIPRIAARARELAEADLACVGLLTPDGASMVIEAAIGVAADSLLGSRIEMTESAALGVVLERRPRLLDGRTSRAAERFRPELDPGPIMALPLHGGHGLRGLLILLRSVGGQAFTPAELEMAAGFAAHAGAALELADARATVQRVVLLENRERSVRELHDQVIQELFAVGVRLEGVVAEVGPESSAGRRIAERAEDVDRTIRRIRTGGGSALRGSLDTATSGFRERLVELCSEHTPALGFPPHVMFAGPLDAALDAALAADLTAVAREALTNVARHAGASQVSLDLSASSEDVVLIVTDNGAGACPAASGAGLAGLRSLAERRGGTSTVTAAPGGGTTLTWRTPSVRS